MTPYPPRPQLYALRYVDWLIQSGTIKSSDPSVFGILVAVVMAEDRIFYKRAPNFYNRQLVDDSAIGSEPALIRARSRAIDAGLLHYEPGAKRRPGRYFTLGFPNELIGKAKGSVRESDVSPNESLGKAKGSVRESDVSPNESLGKAKPSNPTPKNPTPKEDAASGESPSRGKNRKAKTPRFDPLSIEIPEPLRTERFRQAWREWCQHRREIRKPLTPTATGQQIKRLAGMGERRAITAIEHTVAMGWTGLWEPDGDNSRNGSATPTASPVPERRAVSLKELREAGEGPR